MVETDFESVYKEAFPFWEDITEAEREHICSNSLEKNYQKGTNIHDSSECSGVIFVRSGCLRVYMMSDNGKDITLYRTAAICVCCLPHAC